MASRSESRRREQAAPSRPVKHLGEVEDDDEDVQLSSSSSLASSQSFNETPNQASERAQQDRSKAHEVSKEDRQQVEQSAISSIVSSRSSKQPERSKKSRASKKWYADSDSDEALEAITASRSLRQRKSSRKPSISSQKQSPQSVQSDSLSSESRSPTPKAKVGKIETSIATTGARKQDKVATPLQRVFAKTRVLSPFNSKFARDKKSPANVPNIGTPRSLPSNTNDTPAVRPSLVTERKSPALTPINRRVETLKQYPDPLDRNAGGFTPPRARDMSKSPAGATPIGTPMSNRRYSQDVVSPSAHRGRTTGAKVGEDGSGVLLEGWLRQKQRRGVKGFKKWNSRYFVLYAATSEIRYYTDVVQSAWGPIPLGEIGSISLRLIQRIGKPGHPKYKGCRFDITCRNAWGTHYAEDYVSSEEDETPKEGGKKTTPKTRVFSLMADSAQTCVTWVNTLDSRLVRSASSPQVEVKEKDKKVMTDRVVCRPGESVPKPVVWCLKYIDQVTPGIETPSFYEQEPPKDQLQAVLGYLNEISKDSPEPTEDEMEQVGMDTIIAGAVVKTWLRQLESPLIPFPMYQDFSHLAKTTPQRQFESKRELKALLQALPQRNLIMLARLLFHLNDVQMYASKNKLPADVLASHFTNYILRPQEPGGHEEAVEKMVAEMILHADTLIDISEEELSS